VTVTGLTGRDPGELAREVAALHPELTPVVRDGTVRLERERGHELAARLAEALPGQLESVTVARPSLEDVFLRRTGHRLYEEDERENAS
jgi:ABC-2 type transport system ATP-binding protein